MKTPPCCKCGKKSYHFVLVIGSLCTACKRRLEELGMIWHATQEYLKERDRIRSLRTKGE